MLKTIASSKGFTLIEIIAIIVIGAFIAVMFILFMGTSLMYSGESANIINDDMQINKVLENLTTDYRNKVNSHTFDMAAFYTNLSNFEENGVVVSGQYVTFRDGGGNLVDTDADGIYDTLASANPTRMLLITVKKNNQSLRSLFTD